MFPFATRLLICALVLASGCGAPEKPAQAEAAVNSRNAPGTTAEIQSVAATLLGPGAEVLAVGDLAHNGRQQALVANRLREDPGAAGRVVRFTRAAVLERDGAKWTEVLRCDEHLKNPYGYLGGIAPASMTGWELELSRDAESARNPKQPAFLFTPLRAPRMEPMPTVAVRWNASVHRYQSFDRQNGHFLEDVASLETPASPLK
jgi:hypothetical protein